jgi:hypothetical protein
MLFPLLDAGGDAPATESLGTMILEAGHRGRMECPSHGQSPTEPASLLLDIVVQLHATYSDRQRLLVGSTDVGDPVARWLVGAGEAQNRIGGSVIAIDQEPAIRK